MGEMRGLFRPIGSARPELTRQQLWIRIISGGGSGRARGPNGAGSGRSQPGRGTKPIRGARAVGSFGQALPVGLWTAEILTVGTLPLVPSLRVKVSVVVVEVLGVLPVVLTGVYGLVVVTSLLPRKA